jgi:alcohol dehydrogenase
MPKFRGAVLREPGLPRPYVDSRPLEIVELEVPEPGPGEVLVKIAAASLCRSDLSVVTGARVWPLPMVIGHEAAGRVEAVGEGVAGLAAGDDVVLVYLPQCGTCVRCLGGEPWLCETGGAANGRGELITGGTRLVHDGEALHHHMGLAAFAEYALVADKKGQTAAVVGLGAVGLSAILGARAAVAARIFALDLLPAKLAPARELGATDVMVVDENAVAQVREASGGVDHAIEASGTLEGFELAAALVRRGGKVTTLGLPGPGVAHALQLAPLVVSGIEIQGSYLGSCATQQDVPRFIELYREGRFPATALISHRIRLDDINEALDRLADGDALRQVIEFG